MDEVFRSRFSVLDINIESMSQELKDEGFVSNILEHARGVYLGFLGSTDRFEEEHDVGLLRISNGYTMCFGNDEADLWLWIIFYEHHNDPLIELAARAHEETHALHGMGKISLLQEKLADTGVNISFDELKDFWGCTPPQRELIAIIGSLFVLQENGYDVDEAIRRLKSTNPFYPFEQALLLYKAGTKNHIALVTIQ
ncbi:MAG: hypothetical protein HYY55_00985 [Candidatus Niyogibacteria bacterium]|nr:MAG: hypothetical protein HYY55_00985 [Candidatus Niyogibacteria bacterium]